MKDPQRTSLEYFRAIRALDKMEYHNFVLFLNETRQSAQWGTYTPDQRYRQFLKSTKYAALTLEMAVICFMW